MEIPSKKRRVEEKPDFGKCIICQEETRESLVQSVSEEAYVSVCTIVELRTVKMSLLPSVVTGGGIGRRIKTE